MRGKWLPSFNSEKAHDNDQVFAQKETKKNEQVV